jgi:hypothetical protein
VFQVLFFVFICDRIYLQRIKITVKQSRTKNNRVQKRAQKSAQKRRLGGLTLLFGETVLRLKLELVIHNKGLDLKEWCWIAFCFLLFELSGVSCQMSVKLPIFPVNCGFRSGGTISNEFSSGVNCQMLNVGCGGFIPKCSYAKRVAFLPFGVRSSNPRRKR